MQAESADKIVVFDNGEIVEIGNHQELMQKSYGLYRRLYEEQFKNRFTANSVILRI